MAYGRPVVASAVGGLLDAVEHDVTGLLVPPGDVRALRRALERLLGSPGLRERLGG
ncbi:MAG: glycosyltransferase family 1 protein, partial [Thermoleophilia bacterium]